MHTYLEFGTYLHSFLLLVFVNLYNVNLQENTPSTLLLSYSGCVAYNYIIYIFISD
jgi:hypothetical protein